MGIVPKRFHCAMSFAAGGECMGFFSGTRDKTHTFSSSTSGGVLVLVLIP
jgi:hypothetical protein